MDLSFLVDALAGVLSVMGASGVLAAILPRPQSGVGAVAMKAVDVLAANWMNARNAGPAGDPHVAIAQEALQAVAQERVAEAAEAAREAAIGAARRLLP